MTSEIRIRVGDAAVVKIGGSTLGAHDTTLDDVAELQRQGMRCIIVHGGGPLVNDWLKRTGVRTRFERGLRVTDAETLAVVVAVLAGLVNKQLVAALQTRGARAVGLCGVDGGVLQARLADEALGFVGEITETDTGLLRRMLDDGLVPVLAPIAGEWKGRATGQLLNINADSAAGEVAVALRARFLAFLTDVPGVRGHEEIVLKQLSAEDARHLIESGMIEGGMIPKVEACLRATEAGCRAVVLDGREEHALLRLVEGKTLGTVVG